MQTTSKQVQTTSKDDVEVNEQVWDTWVQKGNLRDQAAARKGKIVAGIALVFLAGIAFYFLAG